MSTKILPLAIIVSTFATASYGCGLPASAIEPMTSNAFVHQEPDGYTTRILFDSQIRHEELLDAKMTAEEYLKTIVRDPSSLEIIREEADFGRVDPKRAYIIVKVKYRAKNNLGSLSINEKMFVFDNKLNLKSVQPL
ncbi:hypothetical protein [Spirosoma gilvum]